MSDSNKVTLYTAGTPNGVPISIFLEELKVRASVRVLLSSLPLCVRTPTDLTARAYTQAAYGAPEYEYVDEAA